MLRPTQGKALAGQAGRVGAQVLSGWAGAVPGGGWGHSERLGTQRGHLDSGASFKSLVATSRSGRDRPCALQQSFENVLLSMPWGGAGHCPAGLDQSKPEAWY